MRACRGCPQRYAAPRRQHHSGAHNKDPLPPPCPPHQLRVSLRLIFFLLLPRLSVGPGSSGCATGTNKRSARFSPLWYIAAFLPLIHSYCSNTFRIRTRARIHHLLHFTSPSCPRYGTLDAVEWLNTKSHCGVGVGISSMLSSEPSDFASCLHLHGATHKHDGLVRWSLRQHLLARICLINGTGSRVHESRVVIHAVERGASVGIVRIGA